MKINSLRRTVTGSALAVALIHILVPSITFDSVTIILLVLAVIPWLAPLVKSIELPGGFKIDLQDVKEAGTVVLDAQKTAAIGLETKHELTLDVEVLREAKANVDPLRIIAGTDPNLTLVGFRIEIEKRLRELAISQGIDTSRGLSSMFRTLRSKNLLPSGVIAALDDLIAFGNQAAHGQSVDPQAAAWVLDKGPNVLAALDALFKKR